MSYEASTAALLAPGFTYAELVNPSKHNKQLPPESLQPNIGPALILANTLRARMLERFPTLAGIKLAAAYRPKGGASKSQHKFNRALDLDLFPADYDKTGAWYEEAVRLWCETGGAEGTFAMGLGLYCGPRSTGGIRVHVDVGLRARTWQMQGTKSIRPWVVAGRNVPLARYLAHKRGWSPPVDEDDHEGAEL